MQATLLILPRKIQGFFKIRPVRSGDRDFPSGVGGAARVVRRAEGFKLPMRFRRPGPLTGITRRSSARAHVTVFFESCMSTWGRTNFNRDKAAAAGLGIPHVRGAC